GHNTLREGGCRSPRLPPKMAGRAKKKLNRGNELKDSLKRNGLSVSGAKNELGFECKKRQSKLKNGQKLHDFLAQTHSSDGHHAVCLCQDSDDVGHSAYFAYRNFGAQAEVLQTCPAGNQ